MAKVLRTALLSVVLAFLALPGEAAGGREGDTRCCFANPRFSGICVVVPGPEETCATVLAYLNNPMSTGKTYCGGTDIRGGWRQVQCPSQRKSETAPTVGTAAPRADDHRVTPSDTPRSTERICRGELEAGRPED